MTDKYWQEVSLTVDGEMAEAVAEVLRRYIPDGVVIESTAVAAGPADENGHAVGPLRVCGYIPMDEHMEETRRKIGETARGLASNTKDQFNRVRDRLGEVGHDLKERARGTAEEVRQGADKFRQEAESYRTNP